MATEKKTITNGKVASKEVKTEKKTITKISDVPKDQWDWLVKKQKVCEKLGIDESQVFADLKEIVDNDKRIKGLSDLKNKCNAAVKILKTKYSTELRSKAEVAHIIIVDNGFKRLVGADKAKAVKECYGVLITGDGLLKTLTLTGWDEFAQMDDYPLTFTTLRTKIKINSDKNNHVSASVVKATTFTPLETETIVIGKKEVTVPSVDVIFSAFKKCEVKEAIAIAKKNRAAQVKKDYASVDNVARLIHGEVEEVNAEMSQSGFYSYVIADPNADISDDISTIVVQTPENPEFGESSEIYVLGVPFFIQSNDEGSPDKAMMKTHIVEAGGYTIGLEDEGSADIEDIPDEQLEEYEEEYEAASEESDEDEIIGDDDDEEESDESNEDEDEDEEVSDEDEDEEVSDEDEEEDTEEEDKV